MPKDHGMPFTDGATDSWTRFTIAILASLVLPSVLAAGEVEGFTEPYDDLLIAAPGDPGLLTDVNVREGQRVSQGDVLAVVDTRILEKSLAIAKRKAASRGRLTAMQAELEIRKSRLTKIRQMHEKGHVSNVELQRAIADSEVARANLMVAKEEIELGEMEVERIEARIQRQKVFSPIDGVVVKLYRQAGESILVTDMKLLQLVSLDMLRVRFPVSVPQSMKIQEGTHLTVRLPEINKSAEALVEIVSPVLDAKSGTVEVTCLIDNGHGHYRSGMRCQLELDGLSGAASVADIQFDDRLSRADR